MCTCVCICVRGAGSPSPSEAGIDEALRFLCGCAGEGVTLIFSCFFVFFVWFGYFGWLEDCVLGYCIVVIFVFLLLICIFVIVSFDVLLFGGMRYL